MRFSEQDTQPLPKPKYQPRHKRESNTGMRFLAVLAGLVLFLGIIAWVDWASLGSHKPSPEPTRYVTGPTMTETETVPGNSTTRTVTASPTPGPTTTLTISPSATPTTTATQTVRSTATVTATVPGPTKTVMVPTTVIITPDPKGQ